MIEHPYEWALREGPVGYWTTHRGTFDVVSREDYVFFPDGSGIYRSFSGFACVFTTKFLWQFEAYGRLQFFAFDLPFKTEEKPNPENEDDWQTIHYCGGWIEHTDISKNTPILLTCKRDDYGKVLNIDYKFNTRPSMSLEDGGITFDMKIENFLKFYSEDAYLTP